MPTATFADRWGLTRTVTATNILTGTLEYYVYTATLPAATASRASIPNDYIIGGDPFIVIESEIVNEPPTATVHPLPEVVYSPTVTITWEGQDNQAGVWFYDVQVRDGADGEWTDWQHSTSITSSQFSGEHGHTYDFRSRATDRVGNRASWPEESQAHTRFNLSNTLQLSIGSFFADENRNDIMDISGTMTLEITLTQVSLRFLDGGGHDMVTPTVGSSWAFTTTVYVGETYQLQAISDDYRRVLSFVWPWGGGVYTYTREALGLWPIERIYLPLVLRRGWGFRSGSGA